MGPGLSSVSDCSGLASIFLIFHLWAERSDRPLRQGRQLREELPVKTEALTWSRWALELCQMENECSLRDVLEQDCLDQAITTQSSYLWKTKTQKTQPEPGDRFPIERERFWDPESSVPCPLIMQEVFGFQIEGKSQSISSLGRSYNLWACFFACEMRGLA